MIAVGAVKTFKEMSQSQLEHSKLSIAQQCEHTKKRRAL